MAFEQKTWVDRQSEHPTRRTLTPTGTANEYDVSRSEGLIIEDGDSLNAANLNGMEGRIGAAFAALTSVTVTLTAAGWVDAEGSAAGTAAPYTQSAAVTGMTADWVPGAATVVPAAETTNDALIALREALSMITLLESAAGTLTFVCTAEKPTVDLTVRVPGVM